MGFMMKHYFLILLIIFPFLSGCVDLPNDITAPQWNTELNLPLTNRHYTLDELIKTDDYISIDTANGFVFLASLNELGNKRSTEEFIEGKLDQNGDDLVIPVVNGDGKIGVPFSNGMTLDSASFVRGTITINVQNSSSSPINVRMTLPAFIDNSGTVLTMETTVPGNGAQEATKELSGYRYYAKLQDYGADSLQINGTIIGENFTGNLIIDYGLTNTMFSYIAGIIPPTKLNAIESKTGLPITDDVGDFRDKLKLYDAQITLIGKYIDKLLESDPNNPFKMRIDTLFIKGVRNDDGSSFNLKLNGRSDFNLGPLTLDDNGELIEQYTVDNSNLYDFLAFIPDTIIVTAKPIINPDNERGASTNRDSIQFGFDLQIRSIVSVKELSATDTMKLSMDKDARANLKDFRAATIYFKIDNKIAFGGNIVMHFADSNLTKLFTLDTIAFEPADVDVNGIPSVRHSEPVFELDSAQVQSLAISENIILEVKISTTNAQSGQKVVFSSKDWLDIISYCKVKYHVNLSD